jgi:ATP-dependent RNA helicase DeaD
MISTSAANKGAETVKHIYCISTKSKRYDIIKNIIDINKNIYTIIFCRTRRETNDISNKLIKDNYNAKVLNGDLSQNERDRVMRQFREKSINILVATDVASRGIDVNNLSHIINYNLPDDPEVYVHRSGRTGRAGKEGISIALVSKREYKRLKEIEKLSKISFIQNEAPTDVEVFKSQIKLFTDKMINISIPDEKEKDMFKDFYNKLSHFSKEEIIGKIISMNIQNSNIKNNNTDNDKTSKSERVYTDNQISKLIINIGRSDRINPQALIRLINKTIRSRDTEIGKIDINKNYTTFEVDSKMKKMIISKMKHIRYNRKLILVSLYNPDLIDISKNKKYKPKNRRRRKTKY